MTRDQVKEILDCVLRWPVVSSRAREIDPVLTLLSSPGALMYFFFSGVDTAAGLAHTLRGGAVSQSLRGTSCCVRTGNGGFKGLLEINVEPSEEGEPERSAPDVVIVAGRELVVCEGKFFTGFNTKKLNNQLCAQRRQVQHLFRIREKMLRAFRHVAIVGERPDSTTAIDADVVLTWADIRDLAGELMGLDHYVTVRNLSLVEAENRQWKWRDPATNEGTITPGNWLRGARWLEIVESTRGFGGGGDRDQFIAST